LKAQSTGVLRTLENDPSEEWKHIKGSPAILDTDGSIATHIREVLWMKTDLENLEWQDHVLAIGSYLFKQGIFTEVEMLSTFKLFVSLAQIDDQNAMDVAIYLFNFDSTFDEFIKTVSESLYYLVYPMPSPAVLVKYYEEYFGTVENKIHWLDLDGKISGAKFWDETLDYSNQSKEEIKELLFWVAPDLRSKLVELLIQSEINDLEPESWEDLDEKVSRKDDFLQQFPTSYKVYGSKLSKIPPQSVDANAFSIFPQDIVQEKAFSYAYSRPETEEWFKIFFPGGERIGHSGIYIKTRSGSFLLDYGMTVVNNRIPRWKAFTEKIDAVLLSHAHLDHSGALPFLLRKSGLLSKTPWFGTRDTKVMSQMLFRDTRNVLTRNWERNAIGSIPFVREITSQANITNALENHIEIGTDEEFHPLPNVKVKAFNASHLFGSVGYDIEIGTKRLFYTGDFNLQGSKLFSGAEFPVDDVDTLLFDGTNYGKYEEAIGTVELKQVLKDHKRVIIPAFAMGRTQEILYKLLSQESIEDRKILVVGMGGRLIRELKLSIKRKNVELAPAIIPQEFKDGTILVAGNGMLQAGTSRQILNSTKDDDDVGVVFCGYQSPNTFGYHLLNGNPSLKAEYKQQIYKIKLSGHSTADSLDDFLGGVNGRKAIVHSPEGAFESGKRNDIMRPRDIEGELQ